MIAASKTFTVSGQIKDNNKTAKVQQIIISGMSKATATFKVGGQDGEQVGPVIRSAENNTTECTFKGGLKCDYITLTGTGVSCSIRYK